MSYKKSSIIRIDEEAMKGVLRKIKGSKISRSKFVSEAVAKEVKILDDELNSSMIKAMSDQYYDNEESYKKRGIKSFDEFASKMAKSQDKITELEKKIEVIDKKVKEEKKWNDEIHRMAMQYEKEDPEGAKKVLVKYMEKELSDLKKGIRKQN